MSLLNQIRSALPNTRPIQTTQPLSDNDGPQAAIRQDNSPKPTTTEHLQDPLLNPGGKRRDLSVTKRHC
jgi:hypothetical protein